MPALCNQLANSTWSGSWTQRATLFFGWSRSPANSVSCTYLSWHRATSSGGPRIVRSSCTATRRTPLPPWAATVLYISFIDSAKRSGANGSPWRTPSDELRTSTTCPLTSLSRSGEGLEYDHEANRHTGPRVGSLNNASRISFLLRVLKALERSSHSAILFSSGSITSSRIMCTAFSTPRAPRIRTVLAQVWARCSPSPLPALQARRACGILRQPQSA